VHGIRDHLNRIRADWLNCQQLERTKIPAEKEVSFRLRHTQKQEVVELSLPDLSGETFRLQWETRQWTLAFEKLASATSGVLLFVHPRAIDKPVRIDATVEIMTAAIEAGDESVGSSVPLSGNTHVHSAQETDPTAIIESWSPAHTSTQVQLVEILQFLRARPFLNRTLPIAVIVSAWDLVTIGHTPSDWVEKRLPLLHQFLRANAEAIPSTIFGISAQGGDLSKADELQKHIKASDRIIVTAPDRSTTHDITAPLKWLLER
jgi:hypothetical protein